LVICKNWHRHKSISSYYPGSDLDIVRKTNKINFSSSLHLGVASALPFRFSSHNFLYSLVALTSKPDIYRLLTFHVLNLMSLLLCLGCTKSISPGPRHMFMTPNYASFYSEEFSAPPTPNMEEHPLSAVHHCLSNIFAASLHIRGRYSIHRCEDSIKMNLQEVGWGRRTGLIWLRIGKCGRNL